MAAIDYHEKKLLPGNYINSFVAEHILAETYGWSLKYIRSLPPEDFSVHLDMCILGKKLQVGAF